MDGFSQGILCISRRAEAEKPLRRKLQPLKAGDFFVFGPGPEASSNLWSNRDKVGVLGFSETWSLGMCFFFSGLGLENTSTFVTKRSRRMGHVVAD